MINQPMKMSDPINREVLEILQHSIGVDQFAQGPRHRNYFVAGDGDLSLCLKAVKEGLMVEREGVAESFGGNRCFHVTEKGMTYVDEFSEKPPKKSR